MKLLVVTPSGSALDVEVDAVTAPGVEGAFTVLQNHRPALIMLGGGVIEYVGRASGSLIIRGGLAEVSADRVLVLAASAIEPSEITRALASSALETAQEGFKTSEYLDDGLVTQLRSETAYADALERVLK